MNGTRFESQLACGLLLVTCAACGSDPNGPGSLQAVLQAQTSAQETLTAQGAKLERKEYPQGSAWSVNLSGTTISEETFTALKGLDYVSELNFSESTLKDSQMPRVNELGTVLVRLNLSKTSVGDPGLAHLEAGLLRELDVSGSNVTDDGVSQFLKKRADNPQIMFKTVNVKR